ncbi:hypothetical protein ACHAP5_002669 [Fusarium lateritium]
MVTGLYIGSSVDKRGGYNRLATHEKEANQEDGLRNRHYTFMRQADAIPNFRVVGLWTNPEFRPADETQDNKKWLPIFFEGILMIYLGMYHERNKSFREEFDHIFTGPSYELAKLLRKDLMLPDFQFESLNRAWPLIQGFAHGSYGKCGNDSCKGQAPTKKLSFPDGMFKPGICTDCKRFRSYARRRELFLSLSEAEREVLRARARVVKQQSRARGIAQRTEEEEAEFRKTVNYQNNTSRNKRNELRPADEKRQMLDRKNELSRGCYERNKRDDPVALLAKNRDAVKRSREHLRETETEEQRKERAAKKKKAHEEWYQRIKDTSTAEEIEERRVKIRNRNRDSRAKIMTSLTPTQLAERRAEEARRVREARQEKEKAMTAEEYRQYREEINAKSRAYHHKNRDGINERLRDKAARLREGRDEEDADMDDVPWEIPPETPRGPGGKA